MSGITTLIGRLAEAHAGMTREDARRVYDAAIEAIADELAGGEGLRIPELGTFTVVTRSAGKGTDPRTGEAITWPAKRTVRFKPGKVLRERLNPERKVPRTVAPTKRAAARAAE